MYFLSTLLLSLVSAHCGQLVEPGKLKSVSGESLSRGSNGFHAFGKTTARYSTPLGDWRAPERFRGMKDPEVYKKMLDEGLTVRDLFHETANNEEIVLKFDPPRNNNYSGNTCGYFDPDFKVELLDTNPQSSTTGNNHNGPAEIWIDGVRTHHTSNLLAAQPEVVSREKYNCDKDWCDYKWYWIVFRADHKKETSGSSFQMWVHCAKIKGNGKRPIAVEPTGQWMVDPRDAKGDYNIRGRNVPGLPISPNPSERVVAYQQSPEQSPAVEVKNEFLSQPNQIEETVKAISIETPVAVESDTVESQTELYDNSAASVEIAPTFNVGCE